MMSFLNEQKLVLVLVGPIETPGLINHIKQTHNVIHIDFTDDIRSYYNVADIYIHASIREGLSNSIMEACAMELPCVVSNIKPNMELIEHNKTGLIADLGIAESFADQIKLLISNPELSTQLGRAARANIVKKYEQKKVWNNLKIFYDGLA